MKCDDAVLFNAQRYSIHNMGKLIEDKKCGCFYCGSIFDPMEINEWTDADTALCPYCGIDAILGEYTGLPVALPFLTQMHEYWFGDAEDMPVNAFIVEKCLSIEQYTVLRLNKPLPMKHYDSYLIDNRIWDIVPAYDMPQCIAIHGKHDFSGKTVRFILRPREDDQVDPQRRERAERLLRVDPEMAHGSLLEVGNSNELPTRISTSHESGTNMQGRTRGIIHTFRACPCSSNVVYLIWIIFYPYYVYSSRIARILSAGGRCA